MSRKSILSMKAGEIRISNSLPFTLDQLIPFINEGTIEIAEGVFIVPECLPQNKFRATNKDVGCC